MTLAQEATPITSQTRRLAFFGQRWLVKVYGGCNKLNLLVYAAGTAKKTVKVQLTRDRVTETSWS